MKHFRMFCLLLVLSFAIGALGQGASPASAAKPATPAASPAAPSVSQGAVAAPTIASIVDRQVSQYEKLMVEAAEAMPEDKFNFSPESLSIKDGEFKGVRTFAQLIKHTASANFRFWTALSGEKFPENIKGTNGPDELKTKAEIVQFLKESFAVGHRAAKTLTAENAVETVTMVRGSGPRLALASGAVIHCGDEYGQMVEYLRMNAIVPPASRQQ